MSVHDLVPLWQEHKTFALAFRTHQNLNAGRLLVGRLNLKNLSSRSCSGGQTVCLLGVTLIVTVTLTVVQTEVRIPVGFYCRQPWFEF